MLALFPLNQWHTALQSEPSHHKPTFSTGPGRNQVLLILSIYINSQKLRTAPLASNSISGTSLSSEDSFPNTSQIKLELHMNYHWVPLFPSLSSPSCCSIKKKFRKTASAVCSAELAPTSASSPRALPTKAFSTRLFTRQSLRKRHINWGTAAQRNVR